MPDSRGNVVQGIRGLENRQDSQRGQNPSDGAQSRQEHYGEHGCVPQLYYPVRSSRIHRPSTFPVIRYLVVGDRSKNRFGPNF